MTRVVVGAAIVAGGRLLAQCRAAPAELAGRWELPGGQVEPGESDAQALRRECHEELGALITVADQIGPDVALSKSSVLRIYAARLAPSSPQPRPIEHAELCWVGPAELPSLGWLDADRLLLPALVNHLDLPTPGQAG